jgi:drug/metabolite transporter (DMT)-like permease
MLQLILLTGTLKTFSPYLRKNILLTLDPHDYLFLNTFVIFIFTLIYLLYKIFFQNHDVNEMIKKYNSLTVIQVIFILMMSLVTICSSIIVLNLDKYYNTPLINSMLLKIMSAVLLLFTGIFIFKEKYNYKQIFGLLLAVVGVLLMFNKS